jgi:adenylate cyclase
MADAQIGEIPALRDQAGPDDPRVEAFRATMMGGETDQVRLRRFFRWLPTDPRCKSCNAPFGMPGSIVSRSMGRRRWDKNPRFCNRCYGFLTEYGIAGVEIPITALFADVRESTGMAEALGATEFRRRINGFYRIATDALLGADGIVDKFVGDGVVGMFIPGLSGADHAAKATAAAREIVGGARRTGLPVGAGVHTGVAFVGTVGEPGNVQDFTALGDAVNAAARLSSAAGADEVLVSFASADAGGLDRSGFEVRRLELKGRAEPMDVVVLAAGP